MRTKIQQWGNSLALRIPKTFADETGLHKQSDVELSIVDGHLRIFPVREPHPTLDQLLAEVTDDNMHSEIDTSPPVGREVW